MAAGKRDRRIILKRAGEPTGTDPYGNSIPGDDVEIGRWAEYVPITDRERLAAMEVSAEYTARFSILWSAAVAGVNPTWWIEFEGRLYNIVGAKEIGRRKGIEITAAARADG